jgi:hypothetical protein
MSAPRTFAQVISQGEREGGANLISLRRAVGVLYDDASRFSIMERRAAMAEIDTATKGQPFRLETPAGPMFEELTLWRFAGRSGIIHSTCLCLKACRHPQALARPAWPRTARQAARRLAEAA